MKQFIQKACMSMLWGLLSFTLFAQEKTQAYYNSHENEILPDAQAAFQSGNYSRTIELCNWHYIIVGDQAADSLREMAGRCDQLSKEMNELRLKGDIKEAKQKANAILSINPDDVAAKLVLLIEDPMTRDTVEVELPVIPDETVITPPVEEQMDEAVEEQKQEQERIQQPFEEVSPVPVVSIPDKPQTYTPHTRFVIKVGASLIDMEQASKSITPGGSLGIYDLGGSRIGIEAGVYYCSNFNSTVSLFGMDASLVLRAAKSVYPKVSVGFFSYSPVSANESATQGLCGGASLTFLLGDHFCLEVGAKYYPAFKTMSLEQVIASGISYQFPVVKQFYSGGIAPMISIGWAF